MWENLIDSLNVVLPMFLLMSFGYVLRILKFLPESFYTNAEKFIFKIALPCQLFMSIAFADKSGGGEMYLETTLFCAIGTAVAFLLGLVFVPIMVKDNGLRGAIIQNTFRSNLVILGVPLIENLAGAEGIVLFSVMIPSNIILTNVFAVVELNIFAPADCKRSVKDILLTTTKSVVTNPLIIATLLALPLFLTGFEFPESASFVESTLSSISGTTQALALISLGAGFSFSSLRGKLNYSLATTVYKLVILPIIAVAVAHYAIGFTGLPLSVVFIVFGTPSAVAGYVMAKNMKSDAECASQELLLSTIFCSFTLFLGFFVLKTLNWI